MNRPLTNYDLYDFLKRNNIKANVIMRDEIASNLKELPDTPLISNLEGIAKNGSHWVGIFPTSFRTKANKKILYFDSFGGAPPQELIEYAKQHNKKISYSNLPIQAIGSSQCGKYSAVFIKEMSYGKPFYDFLYQFPRTSFLTISPEYIRSDKNEVMIDELFNDFDISYSEDSSDDVIIGGGAGGDIVASLNKLVPFELHWFDADKEGKIKRASFLGPNTKLTKRLKDYDRKTGKYSEVITEPISELDRLALYHDTAYHSKKIEDRHRADKELEKGALKIFKDSTANKINRINAGLVYLIIKGKRKLGGELVIGGAIGPDANAYIRAAQIASQSPEFTHSGPASIAKILVPLIILTASIGIPAVVSAFKKNKKNNK